MDGIDDIDDVAGLEDREGGLSPFRRRLVAVMTPLFVVLLAVMLVGGAVLALSQLALLAVGDSTGIVAVADTLNPVVFGLAATVGVLSLLLAYAHGWKAAE